MEIPRYKTSQQELYKIARMGWSNYSSRILEFSNFKPRYTAGYGKDCLAEIVAAQALPTNNASSGDSGNNRILLGRSAEVCLLKWQHAKRYIMDTYDAGQLGPMLKAAGQSHYLNARNYKWQSVTSMMDEGSAFIKKHGEELMANDNMPPSFGEGFDSAKASFTELQDQFLGSVANGTMAVQTKMAANNSIHDKLAKMLQDGQQIFANNEGVRQQFVFSNLKGIVTGVNQAGLRGFVTDAGTGLPVKAANVATANNIYSASTDEMGRFDLLGLPAADYTLTITAAGYIVQTTDVTIKTGTVSSQNASLAKEPIVISEQ